MVRETGPTKGVKPRWREAPMIVSDVLNNSMRATNRVYANGEPKGGERASAVLDFPRMRAERDKTRTR